MGNALRAASPSPGPPGKPPISGELPPTPVLAPVPVEVPKESSPPLSELPTNPGTYEDLNKKCKDLFPTPYDGFRLAVNKGLSNHFQVSHTLNLSGGPQGSSYHFGATYVGANQISPAEAYPVILGDIDNSGSLSAQIIHQFNKKIRAKLVVQTQQKEFAMVQVDGNYITDTSTATLTLGNIDVLNESGIVVGHYLQRVTQNLDLGAELLYHYGSGQESAMLSLAGRYSRPKWVAAATFSGTGWHASYYHKGNDNVQVGVDYEYSSRLQDSCVSFGYQVDIPKANVTFRGLVDTNWTVAGVFEKRLLPLPFTFTLSGMLNHAKNQCRFGFGLQIG